MLNRMRHWFYISTKGQAKPMTLHPTHFGLPHTNLNIIFPEITWLFELKFYMEHSVDINIILDQNGHHAHIG